MKWFISIIVVILLVVGGYFAAAHFSGGALPTFGIAIGGEKSKLRSVVLKFWEDVKFRDLRSAANYLPQAQRDPAKVIGFLTQIFKTPSEALDLINYKVEVLELDSTELRGRVKMRLTANNLASGEAVDVETMLFFYREADGQKWLLELGNSF